MSSMPPRVGIGGLDIRDISFACCTLHVARWRQQTTRNMQHATRKSMQRSHIIRPTLLFLAIGAWAFLMLSLASFHPTDWPSHAVFPSSASAVQNMCGSVGAWCAYYAFLALGQGVFLILFFTGICLALVMFNNRIGDVWLRTIGLLLLTIAFAATIHHFKPTAANGFPEGQGGIMGIGTAHFLQSHFSTVGTRLVLLVSLLIGLLLAADDLVLRTPGVVTAAISEVKDRTPQLRFSFPPLPKLPSIPGFVTRDAKSQASGDSDDDDDELRPVSLTERMRRKKDQTPAQDDSIELTHHNDDP